MLNVICVSCENSVSEKDYNLDTKIAYCISCDTLFNFDPLLSIQTDTSHKKVEKPNGIIVKETFSGHEISLHHSKIHNPVGSILFGLFIILVPVGALIQLNSQNELPWPAYLVLGLFGAIGLFKIYKAIRQYSTITSISITKKKVKISSKSNYSKPTTSFEIERPCITQLFVRKRAVENENSTTYYYDLGIADTKGTVHYVLKNYLKAKYLLFLETTIENILDIKDKPHPEEMRNSELAPKNLREAFKVAKYMHLGS